LENDPRRFHHIVANAVARHPRNFVFGHRKPILSASAPPASEPRSFWRRPRITRIKRIGDTEQKWRDARSPHRFATANPSRGGQDARNAALEKTLSRIRALARRNNKERNQ